MHSKLKGDISEAMVTAAMMRADFKVLKPIFGENYRYDFVIDRGKGFERVQCKTGRLKNGCVVFSTKSVNWSTKATKDYKNDIEFFAVYCAETQLCYLIPIDECGTSATSLRINLDTLNNQKDKVKKASDYLISPVF